MNDLFATLLAEHQPATTLERHLTQQLANVLRKQTQAEDNETALLAHAPEAGRIADPHFLLYHQRVDVLHLHQARLGREQSRILRELHRLKRTPLVPKPATEPKARPAPPVKMSWVADIMAEFDKKAAHAASESGTLPMPPANEPGKPPAEPASEPKPTITWPVLDDAAADAIGAMIASGDPAQLAEAARRLGIRDGGASAA